MKLLTEHRVMTKFVCHHVLGVRVHDETFWDNGACTVVQTMVRILAMYNLESYCR